MPEKFGSSKEPDSHIVDAAGNGDYLTIGEAIDALGGGAGVIHIKKGEYSETIKIPWDWRIPKWDGMIWLLGNDD